MPTDTNANGDIFGGWLMSQMDIGGAILAKGDCTRPRVTVRVDGITFLRSVAVGDVVCCYARCLKTGNSSMTVKVEVWVEKWLPILSVTVTGQIKKLSSVMLRWMRITVPPAARRKTSFSVRQQ